MKGMYLLRTLGLIIAAVLIVITLWPDNTATTALLLVLVVITLYFWRTPRDLSYFFVSAIIGPLAEVVCILYGAWLYSNPTYIIPIWLPLVWGLAGISMGRLADLLTGFKHPNPPSPQRGTRRTSPLPRTRGHKDPKGCKEVGS